MQTMDKIHRLNYYRVVTGLLMFRVSTEGAAISDSVSKWLEQSRKILCKSVLSLVHIFICSLGIREENGLLNLQQRSSRKRTQVISEVKIKLKLLGIWYKKVEFCCAEWNRWEKSTSHRKQKTSGVVQTCKDESKGCSCPSQHWEGKS